MVQALKNFFKNYVNFKGRATRSDYWWVVLWSVIFAVAFWIIYFITLITYSVVSQNEEGAVVWALLLMIPYWIVCLGIFIPSLSLMCRRFHDAGISSLWYIIPFISQIVLVFPAWIAAASIGDASQASDGVIIALAILFIAYYLVSIGFSIFNFVVTLLPSKPDNKWGVNPHKAKLGLNETSNNFCPSCGAPLKEGASFCSNCGNKI